VLYTKSTLANSLAWTAVGKIFVDPATGNAETMSTVGACGVTSSGDAIIFNSGSARSIVSNDGGLTWSSKTTPAIFNIPLVLSNKFIFFQQAAQPIAYTLPLRTYDPATSFITSKTVAQPLPLLTYMKGKLV
jgi:hypothetical protein